jgi:predicted ATPase
MRRDTLPADTHLIERAHELGVMHGALLQAERGDGQFIVVHGEPGIGKSRLLEVMEMMAKQRAAGALRAAGDQLEVGFPFGVVRQLLEPALAALPASEQQSVLAGNVRQAAGLLGRAPADHLPQTAPDCP